MPAKRIIPMVAMILIVVAATSMFLLEKRKTSASICPACNREIHRGWAFTLTFKDGTKKTLCCAKCGIAEQMSKQPNVVSATATDFATGKPLQAEKAIYVWNSNLEHCKVPEKRDSTDQHPMQLAWDRCIPSLIAFADSNEAANFQSEHGGRIVSYNESVRLVKSPPAAP